MFVRAFFATVLGRPGHTVGSFRSENSTTAGCAALAFFPARPFSAAIDGAFNVLARCLCAADHAVVKWTLFASACGRVKDVVGAREGDLTTSARSTALAFGVARPFANAVALTRFGVALSVGNLNSAVVVETLFTTCLCRVGDDESAFGSQHATAAFGTAFAFSPLCPLTIAIGWAWLGIALLLFPVDSSVVKLALFTAMLCCLGDFEDSLEFVNATTARGRAIVAVPFRPLASAGNGFWWACLGIAVKNVLLFDKTVKCWQ